MRSLFFRYFNNANSEDFGHPATNTAMFTVPFLWCWLNVRCKTAFRCEACFFGVSITLIRKISATRLQKWQCSPSLVCGCGLMLVATQHFLAKLAFFAVSKNANSEECGNLATKTAMFTVPLLRFWLNARCKTAFRCEACFLGVSITLIRKISATRQQQRPCSPSPFLWFWLNARCKTAFRCEVCFSVFQ